MTDRKEKRITLNKLNNFVTIKTMKFRNTIFMQYYRHQHDPYVGIFRLRRIGIVNKIPMQWDSKGTHMQSTEIANYGCTL